MLKRFFCLIAYFFVGNSTLIAMFFAFSDHPIDVVIPCVEKDLSTLNLCIRGIRENGVNIRRIIVVSKKRLTEEAEWFNESNYPFSFQEVATALARNNPKVLKLLLKEGARTGWYYQQLLKFYAPLVISDISSNVLVLDADTIFLRPVAFLNRNGGGMYNPGQEYYSSYFEHGARLIPGFYKYFPKYSGISHHMIFQRSVIEALLKEAEYHHDNAPFWQIFCQLVDPKHLFYSGASEYEIYFNYIFSHTNQVSIRKLKWKNIEKLSEINKFKKAGLDYVCLHTYDRVEE
jgi:hypothetical protein